MLIIDFILSKSLIILYIYSIFFANKLGNFSLIFKILPTLEANAWVYDSLLLGLDLIFSDNL